MSHKYLAAVGAVMLWGAILFSGAQAQSVLFPPAQTPESAAANFMGAFAELAEKQKSIVPSQVDIRSFEPLQNAISRVQLQKIKDFNVDNRDSVNALLQQLFSLRRSLRYEGKTTPQGADKAVVQLKEKLLATPPPIVCVAEDGGWRVDLLATYAKWKNLSDRERDTMIAMLTGEIPPALADDAELVAKLQLARASGIRGNCSRRLQQISLAMVQYAQDYDDVMPPAREWSEVIKPYEEAMQPYEKDSLVFRCPTIDNGSGYAFNTRLSRKSLNVVGNAYEMVSLYETSDLRTNAFGLGENLVFRHLDGANYAFADGHAKWFPKKVKQQFTFKP